MEFYILLYINVRDRDVEHQTQHTDDVRMFIWVLIYTYTWYNNKTNILHEVTEPYNYIDIVHERTVFQFSHSQHHSIIRNNKKI